MPIDSKELLFVVDEDNNPLPPKPRGEVHAKGYWHRNSHVWIVNPKNQTLCGKRSMLKDACPGRWDPIFGGHVNAGEENLDCAAKELKEELGISVDPARLEFRKLYKSEKEREFNSIYLLYGEFQIDELHIEQEELDRIEWRDNSELIRLGIDNNPDWVSRGYENEILNLLVQDKK